MLGCSGEAIAVQVSPMGEQQVEMKFDDYKTFDDVQMPTKTVVTAGPQEFVMIFDKVIHNTKIPDEKFKLPSEIQALLTKPTDAKAKVKEGAASAKDAAATTQPKKKEGGW